MSIDDIQQAGVFGAVAAVGGTLILLAFNPSGEDVRRLEAIESQVKTLPKAQVLTNASVVGDVTLLMQQPIFVMSTGAGAYKEKTVKLIGVSVSPGRKAALVSVDGGPPVWMRAGETQDELILIEVGANAVRFDTPVGPRTIGFNDPSAGGV